MLASGDWVTPHLNGVLDMEKPPLQYWLIALSNAVFGVHDWYARLPLTRSPYMF
jgi:4-amino-4-deoxy-L-arabinose transferase-like glycosyltransferase